MCSKRGPQESAQIFLNTSRSPAAAKGLRRGGTFSNGLNASGSRATGSKYRRSPLRFSGIERSTFSARSPCGSSKATPSPCAMSCVISVSRSVDFPVPVLPITYIAARRSARLMPNVCRSLRKFVRAKNTMLLWKSVGIFVSSRAEITGTSRGSLPHPARFRALEAPVGFLG